VKQMKRMAVDADDGDEKRRWKSECWEETARSKPLEQRGGCEPGAREIIWNPLVVRWAITCARTNIAPASYAVSRYRLTRETATNRCQYPPHFRLCVG
jgi:hypothetical protein